MTEPTKLSRVSEDVFFSDASLVSGLSDKELSAHVQATRESIASALDELEDAANPAKAVARAKVRLQARLSTMKREQPLALAAIGLGAVVVAGLIVTAVVKSSRR